MRQSSFMHVFLPLPIFSSRLFSNPDLEENIIGSHRDHHADDDQLPIWLVQDHYFRFDASFLAWQRRSSFSCQM